MEFISVGAHTITVIEGPSGKGKAHPSESGNWERRIAVALVDCAARRTAVRVGSWDGFPLADQGETTVLTPVSQETRRHHYVPPPQFSSLLISLPLAAFPG